MSAINSVPRKHRIGIDIDENNQCRLLIKYLNACRFGKSILYKSGKGHHIQIVKMNRTPEENLTIRRIIGDCKGRMDLDENRYDEGLYDIIETLFFDKRVHDYKGVETIVNPLAQPFWSFPR